METLVWKLKMVWISILKVLGLKKSNTKVTVETREISEEELPPDIKSQILKKYGHL